MKGKRFSEEQIIKVIQESVLGVPVADVCRKHGVSSDPVREQHRSLCAKVRGHYAATE